MESIKFYRWDTHDAIVVRDNFEKFYFSTDVIWLLLYEFLSPHTEIFTDWQAIRLHLNLELGSSNLTRHLKVIMGYC